jgi:mRNA interferase MazF
VSENPPPAPRRGQVWSTEIATRPGGPLLVVVSDEAYNAAHPKRPIVVRLYAGQLDQAELPPEVIPTAEGDPVTGYVIAYELARPHVSRLGLVLGQLTSATLARVDAALRDLLGL